MFHDRKRDALAHAANQSLFASLLVICIRRRVSAERNYTQLGIHHEMERGSDVGK